MKLRIYLASSWRNVYQPTFVQELRAAGYEVYDFRNPDSSIGSTLIEGSLSEGARGQGTAFQWSQIEPEWKQWDAKRFRASLNHPIAKRGFDHDFNALKECHVCILLLPCNRSAHLELGWAVGAGKYTAILMLGENEPELMYRMVNGLFVTLPELLDWLNEIRKHIQLGIAEWDRYG